MLGVLLLGVLTLELLLVLLMLLGVGGDVGILFGEDKAGGDIVVLLSLPTMSIPNS